MITKEEFIVIHTLYKQGLSIRKIAKIVGLDRRTVSKRLKESEYIGYNRVRKYKSKLDLYKKYIQKRVKETLPNKIPSSVIYDEIKRYGYEGKIRILQNYLSKLYKEEFHLNNYDNKKEEVIRFETNPGFQAQVDWTVIRSGKSPIYAFVMVLGYSRYSFVYFTNNMTGSTWQKCHIKAFEYFNGIPKTILYDNLKSVVIQRDKYGKNNHGFNNGFLDFSKDLFVAKLCKPYRAKTKGKVERFNRYLKENFYIPLKAKLKNTNIPITIELLNSKIFSWLEFANSRIHNTTKQTPKSLFNKEQTYLQPLIKSMFDKKDFNNKNINNQESKTNKINNIPKIDISYYTSLKDYDKLLNKGVANVVA